MTKQDDEIRELKSQVAETLNAADDLVGILKEEEGAEMHYRLVQWLRPQAQRALDRLRKGEYLAPDSDALLSAQALAVVLDHFDYLIQDTVDAMTDEEYEELMEMGKRGER